MIPSLSIWLLFGGTLSSSALAHKIHIISPQPGGEVQAGCTSNITLQIEHALNGSFQQVLGFGLNSEFAAHPKALGEVFLGMVNSTQAPVDPSTGQQSFSLAIPSQDKFVKGIEGSYTLVISQYVISGPLHTPHCSLVSVPVNVTAGNCSTSPSNDPASGTPEGSDCGDKPCPGTQAPTGDRSGSSGLLPPPSGNSNSSTSSQPPVPLDTPSSHPSGAGAISTVSPPGSGTSNMTSQTPHEAGNTGKMTSPDTPHGAGSAGSMNGTSAGTRSSGYAASPASPKGAGGSGMAPPDLSTDRSGNSGSTTSPVSHQPGSSGNTSFMNNGTSHPTQNGAGGAGKPSPVTSQGAGSSDKTPLKPVGASQSPMNSGAGNSSSSPMSSPKSHNATSDATHPTESSASGKPPGPNIFTPPPSEKEGNNSTSPPDTSAGSALAFNTRTTVLTLALTFTATLTLL